MNRGILDRRGRDNGLIRAKDWNPQLDQGASLNIAKTIGYAYGTKVGRLCTLWWSVTATGTGTATNAVTITIPQGWEPTTAIGAIGIGFYADAGVATYCGVCSFQGTNRIGLYRTDVTITGLVGFDPNIAVASGDIYQGYASWISKL